MQIGNIELPLQPLGMGNTTESGGRLPVAVQGLQEILLRKRRPLGFQGPVAQIAILLRLTRLMVQTGVEQGVGLLKLTVVHLHAAKQSQPTGILGLQGQRLVQITPAFLPGLQPLDMAEAVAVGLPIGKVGLQKQAGNLGLLGLGYMNLMLGLHGTPHKTCRGSHCDEKVGRVSQRRNPTSPGLPYEPCSNCRTC